jgi:mono/diheme cytochrome c family protein
VLPDDIVSVDDPRLLALGAQAFRLYPVQLMPFFSLALTSRAAAASYGVWVDDAAGVGGLVRARMADGAGALSVTCATCHESPLAGALQPGLPNVSLQLGQAILDAAGGAIPPSLATAIAAWGPGRLDVTTNTGLEVVRIGDLRPVRWQEDLQADATVDHRDLTSLAIRIETLIITSNDDALRPPRLVSLALAAYISSLSDGLPPAPSAASTGRGGEIFASECASCHRTPSLSGPAIPLAVIGTDPTLGLSSERGTGTYRVPSLHGVGTRGPLLHDGTVASVAGLFDPARPTSAFTGRAHGEGAVPGHLYGLELDDADRAALVAYVDGL